MAETLNVLLVVLEGARADHLSCYGSPRETTPFLDSLAAEGLRFHAAFATAPATLAAHASLFTGLFTTTHGASDERPFLSQRHPTLAEILRAAGYRTGAFCSNPWVQASRGFGRGFEVFQAQRGVGSIARAAFYARRATDRLLRRSDAGARRTNMAFFDWLGGRDEPFLAFLHYSEPRLARQRPAHYERYFLPPEVKRGQVRAIERDWSRAAEAAENGRQILTGLYDGALRYVDVRLAEIAEHLKARGQWDRTLVVVTADHGQDLGEHERPSSGVGLYDTWLRVPLLLRCPPILPQGFVVDELAQHVDVLPTILALVGQEEKIPPVHGRPLLRQGRPTRGPGFAVAERFRPDLEHLRKRLRGGDPHPFDVRERAIRTRREKFIWRSDENNELYDLVSDPGERQNLIHTSGERARALRTQLFDWLASVERSAGDEPASAEAEDVAGASGSGA